MQLDPIDVLMDNTLLKADYGAVVNSVLEGDADAQCYLSIKGK